MSNSQPLVVPPDPVNITSKGQISQILTDAGVPQGVVQKMYRGISRSTIIGARGAKPQQGLMTYVFVMADKTGSFARWAQEFIDYYNNVYLFGMRESSDHDKIMVAFSSFNDENYRGFLPDPNDPDDRPDPLDVVHAALPVESAPMLTAAAFEPNMFTPLYDASIAFHIGVMAYIESLISSGVSIHRAVALTFSDGLEESDGRVPHFHASPTEVSPIITQMRDMGIYIPVFVGFGHHNFESIAAQMGYDKDNVLTTAATSSGLRHIMEVASRQSVSVSRSTVGPGNKFFKTT